MYKKKWQDTSLSTRRSRVSKAKESIVAALNVIAPGDAGPLWAVSYTHLTLPTIYSV